MGIGTWVVVVIGAWIALSLPVGLLIGAMAHSSRHAPQRSTSSTTTRTAMTNLAHTLHAQTDTPSTRRTLIADLAQV